MKRKIISAVTAVILFVIVCQTPPGEAIFFADTDRHWAADVIDTWSSCGIIQGDNGYFRPNENITRADLAIIVSRVMGLKKKSQAEFSDLDGCTEEQRTAILKLNAAGFMNGSNGYMRPNDYISREEAACLLGRAMRLDELAGAYRKFADMDQVSGWAAGMVRAMAAKGYISGRLNDRFEPKANITRAEAVKILDNMIKAFYHKAGTYSVSTLGSVVINCTGVELKNVAITGDLYITENVGEGVVTLNDVTVGGNVYVMGGGTKSINLRGNTRLGRVYHEKTGDAAVKYSVPPPAAIDSLYVPRGTAPVEYEGALKTMLLSCTNQSIKLTNATVGTILADAPGIRLFTDANTNINTGHINYDFQMLGDGIFSTVSLQSAAAGSSFERQPKIIILPPGMTVFMDGEPFYNPGVRAVTITSTEDNQIPGAVNAQLSATKLFSDGATITWTAASDNLTAQSNLRYALYASSSAYMKTVQEIEQNGIMLSPFTANKLSADVSGLKNGATYYFNVIVKDQAENKSCYSRFTLKIGSDTSAPYLSAFYIQTTNIKTTEVTLNWSIAFDNITPESELEYAVYRSETPYLGSVAGCEAYGTLIMPYTKNVLTCRASGLTENKTYYFNVVVKDSANNKSCYYQVSAIPCKDTSPPIVPVSDITISQITDKSALISWAAASDIATAQNMLKYALYYSDAPNIDTVENIKKNGKGPLLAATVNRLSYAFSGDASGPHYVNVLVQDEASNVSCYTMLSFFLGTDVSAPAVLNPCISIAAWTENSVSLSWQAADDRPGSIPGSAAAELQYAVYRVPANAVSAGLSGFDTVAEIEATAEWHSAFTQNMLSAAVTGLTKERAYIFNVIVKDKAGFLSCYSPVIAITDKTPPAVTYAAVTGAPNADGSAVTVHWSPAYDNITAQNKLEYAVYCSENTLYSTISDIETKSRSLMGYTKASDLPALSATVSGILYSRPYNIYVIVKDEAGNKTSYTAFKYERLDHIAPELPPDATVSASAAEGTIPGKYIINLSWQASSDNVTLKEDIMYSVFFTTNQAVYTTPEQVITAGLSSLVRGKGITQIAHPDRSSGSYVYYVISEDASGNKVLYDRCVIAF
ncbi:MAG: S-layer homology domain-containing protein [Clostridiales bacterium]|nr:S-layer homology domain-containing protein [Clostridiales bacterium]